MTYFQEGEVFIISRIVTEPVFEEVEDGEPRQVGEKQVTKQYTYKVISSSGEIATAPKEEVLRVELLEAVNVG